MTEKQADRHRNKIRQIKAALAADKRRWGGFYDDSRGLRYLPLEHFIKLKDYSGGKRYVNWFFKNFPDDMGHPQFLFECCMILFYTKERKSAQKKLFQTFTRNNYVIDKYLGKEIQSLETDVGYDKYQMEYLDYLIYSGENEDFVDFTHWVEETVQSVLFQTASKEYFTIQQALKKEEVYEKRLELLEKEKRLKRLF